MVRRVGSLAVLTCLATASACGVYSPLPEIGSEPDTGEPECELEVEPRSFEVSVNWTHAGMDAEISALAVPAVGDLDGDGVPEVVVTVYVPGEHFGMGHLHVLDGATGALELRIDTPVAPTAHSALADIDGDGAMEIVGFGPSVQGRLLAFEADGTQIWAGDTEFPGGQYAIGIADFDGDGDVEIYAGGHLADHEGRKIFDDQRGMSGIQASTAADLDGDGDLELIIGSLALHHDGSVYYDHLDAIAYGHPQIADLDGDGEPEILLTTPAGPRLIQHDGTLEPVDDTPGACAWAWMPAAIGDFDGDGSPEIFGASNDSVCMAEAGLTTQWTHCITWEDGYAGTAAFDFFADGRAEAIYADNTELIVFGDDGTPLFTTPRRSVTQIEFPVVADVDADGSADILIIANAGYAEQSEPAVQLLSATARDWAPARPIWNQYTFHGTNIDDAGTVPATEPRHWLGHNSYRVQQHAQ